MTAPLAVGGIVLVLVATLVVGGLGLRVARTTSDFFVASRTVGARLNASAIGGEYLSAASFLGVAGLVLTFGADMLWYPIGWTAGYLLLLALVAAPLRRSGAYTLPDFAESRLESHRLRLLASALVVAVGWLYLLPQFQGAGLTLAIVTGADPRLGAVVVAVVVVLNVVAGGMRAITLVQAMQYWLKLTALLVPVMFLLLVWLGDGAPSPAMAGGTLDRAWADPLATTSAYPIYTTYSIAIATFLGTMGLPHVVVRFYTNPDGRAARRTTLWVLVLLGVFYLLPPVYGALGRLYAPDLLATGHADAVVLELPRRMVPGLGGELLSSLTTAGAFAAFLSTSSGLTVAVAGVLTQDLLRRRLPDISAFRVAAVAAVIVPLALAMVAPELGVARVVGLAFAFSASTFCPLLVLGIWWRRLTDAGAAAGMVAGGVTCGLAILDNLLQTERTGLVGALLAQPAAWTVPLAFATMVAVSLATPQRVPSRVGRAMVRLHAPEGLALRREDQLPDS